MKQASSKRTMVCNKRLKYTQRKREIVICNAIRATDRHVVGTAVICNVRYGSRHFILGLFVTLCYNMAYIWSNSQNEAPL